MRFSPGFPFRAGRLTASAVALTLLVGCGAPGSSVPLAQTRQAPENFYNSLGLSGDGTLKKGASSLFSEADFAKADDNRDARLSKQELEGFFSDQPDAGVGSSFVPSDPAVLAAIGLTGGVLAGYLAFVGYKLSGEIIEPKRASVNPAQPGDNRLATSDGKTLAFTYVSACEPSEAAVILCHGQGGSKSAMNEYGAFLNQRYHTLAFDFRNHGASSEARSTGGATEAQDVLAAVSYLKAKGIKHIGVLGLGMGGVAALAAAAKSAEIEGVVTDGAYASMLDELTLRAKAHRYPLGTMAARAGRGMLAFRTKAKLDEGDAIRNVATLAKTPVLFVQGEQDRTVGTGTAQALYDAKPDFKGLYTVPGAESGTCHKVAGQAYERRLLDFFADSLK